LLGNNIDKKEVRLFYYPLETRIIWEPTHQWSHSISQFRSWRLVGVKLVMFILVLKYKNPDSNMAPLLSGKNLN